MGESVETAAPTRARGVRRAKGVARALAHYAVQLGCSERTLKGWLKIGRQAVPPDPCPLDEPMLLAAWWSRRMKQRVPDQLLKLATGMPAATVVSASSVPQTGTAGLPLFTLPGGAANVVEVGFSASLKRIRQAEATASAAYLAAVQENKDAGVIEQRQRAWERTLEALRKAEKDGAELLRESGRLMDRDDVKRALVPRHRAIVAGIRSLLRRVRPKLSGVPPAEQDRIWHAETEQLLRWLCDNEFSGKLETAA